MKEQLDSIVSGVRSRLPEISLRGEFEQFKATITGPNGSFTAAMKGMKDVPKEERPAMGKLINDTKVLIESLYAQALSRIESLELETVIQSLIGPAVDPSLPSPAKPAGTHHPLTLTRRRIESVFRGLGFSVAEGPEADTEWFCFDALNTPPDHPARDIQDTLFFPEKASVASSSRHSSERFILRSHTSTVQIRTLLAEPLPLRIIAPGRVFRRDTVDATHSANFHQCEGLYVNHKVTLVDLKAVLDHFVKAVFGSAVETRLRPSFFPFTEPSFEMDIRSSDLGRLSNRWIEIMGCGMVDPNVFKAAGIDPEVWSGYAFGVGLERIAMILHGIDDIRHFYTNDLRFLKQFA